MIWQLVVRRQPVGTMLTHAGCVTRGRSLGLAGGVRDPDLFGVVEMTVDAPCATHLYGRRERIPNEYYLGMTVPLMKRSLGVAIDGRSSRIPPGHFALGNPTEVHDVLPDQAFHARFVVWSQPLLREWRDRLGLPRAAGGFDFVNRPLPVTREMRAEMDRLAGWLAPPGGREDPWVPLDVYAAGLRLFSAVWRTTASGLRSRLATVGYPRPVDPRVDRVVEQMRTHLADFLTNGQLARVAGVSASNMYKLFGRQFGCSPRQFLRRIRLEEADRLRRNSPHLSLVEVARRVGFERWESLTKAPKPRRT